MSWKCKWPVLAHTCTTTNKINSWHHSKNKLCFGLPPGYLERVWHIGHAGAERPIRLHGSSKQHGDHRKDRGMHESLDQTDRTGEMCWVTGKKLSYSINWRQTCCVHYLSLKTEFILRSRTDIDTFHVMWLFLTTETMIQTNSWSVRKGCKTVTINRRTATCEIHGKHRITCITDT